MPLFVQSRAGILVEPVVVPEIAYSGFARIEFMGDGQACVVLYRNAIAPATGELERQACGRLFGPIAAIPEAMDLMIAALLEAGAVKAAAIAKFLM